MIKESSFAPYRIRISRKRFYLEKKGNNNTFEPVHGLSHAFSKNRREIEIICPTTGPIWEKMWGHNWCFTLGSGFATRKIQSEAKEKQLRLTVRKALANGQIEVVCPGSLCPERQKGKCQLWRRLHFFLPSYAFRVTLTWNAWLGTRRLKPGSFWRLRLLQTQSGIYVLLKPGHSVHSIINRYAKTDPVRVKAVLQNQFNVSSLSELPLIQWQKLALCLSSDMNNNRGIA